ncbi:MAG: glycoside hydrolase family 5 protein [Thermoproteota archaeon]|nr:glycoside hydrolase family 5 protein [Candidatus Brockarchaeota archaeon]
MLSVKVLILPVVVLLLGILPTKVHSQRNDSNNLPWLKTNGKYIVDESGNIIILRGTNYMGMEFGWFGHSEEDFKRIRDWGFTVVRLPIAWSYIEPKEGYYNDSYLKIVDKVISWCKKYNLYVILDMHQWNWAPKFGGNGLPNWAVEKYSTQDEAKVGFFNNETLQNEFFKLWTYVAERYKNESTIFAYDILNEPNVNYNLMNRDVFIKKLQLFYQGAINAIRKVDNKHVLFVEPPWGNEVEAFENISFNDSNLVLSTHLYTEGTWDGKTGYDGDSKKLEADFLRGYNLSLKWNVPLFVGEFGVGSSASKAHEWVRDYVNIFDKYMVSFTWWTYWRDDSSFGLLTSKGEEKENLLSALLRIYPYNFTLPPEKFSYDIYKNVSIVEWSLDNKNNKVRVLFKLPLRIGENFSVSSDFSKTTFSYNKALQELEVVAQGEQRSQLIVSSRNLSYRQKTETNTFIQFLLPISLVLNFVLVLLLTLSKVKKLKLYLK